jgi:His-Xaa-Ser system protein HxsD
MPPSDPRDEPQKKEPEVERFAVNTALYSKEALFRACYVFTDRCYLFLDQGRGDSVVVEFRKRQLDTNLREVVGAFANELISQRVRADLSRETQAIRELIVAEAFRDADLRDTEP